MIGRHAMGCPTSVGLHAVTVSVSTATTTQRTAMTESLNADGQNKSNPKSFDEWVREVALPKLYSFLYDCKPETYPTDALDRAVAAIAAVTSVEQRLEYFRIVADSTYQPRGSDEDELRRELIAFYILGCMSRDSDFEGSEPGSAKLFLGKLGEAFSSSYNIFKRVNMSFFQRIVSTRTANTFMHRFYYFLKLELNEMAKYQREDSDFFKKSGKGISHLKHFVFEPRGINESGSYTVEYAYTTLRWLCNIPLEGDGNETIAATQIYCGKEKVTLVEQLVCAAPIAKGFLEDNPDDLLVLCPSWKTLGEFFTRINATFKWRYLLAPVELEHRYRTVYF